MGRRAGYMYGALLERGPDGQLGSGLGKTTSLGTITLIPPNLEIVETGQEETVDGVRMGFQLTPGTEAPAEMNIHFPDAASLCIADNVARSMHNILTPRGALVRDPRIWAHYLDEAIELFAAELRRALRRPPLAAAGGASGSSTTSRSSATSTPTCTTRPCACSTRASPGRRSPS